MELRWLVIVIFIFCTAVPCRAEKDKVVLATLEWPPYTGADLPGNGASAVIVREALKAAGLELEIRFYPWSRLLNETANDPEIDGYFPEYAGRESQYLYSAPIGKSLLGFAKRSSISRSWLSYDDLKEFRIGIVSGYVNEPKFDKMVEDGKLKISKATHDLFNLRKVLEKRIDMAVVDVDVFRYFMAKDPFLKSGRGELIIDPHLMSVNRLFVCFPKTERGEKLLRRFNEGLSKVDAGHMQREYMDGIESELEIKGK